MCSGKSCLSIKLGATSIGIRTDEGIVLAAEKRATSKLLVNDSIDKISKVDDHIGWCIFLIIIYPMLFFSHYICWPDCGFSNVSKPRAN